MIFNAFGDNLLSLVLRMGILELSRRAALVSKGARVLAVQISFLLSGGDSCDVKKLQKAHEGHKAVHFFKVHLQGELGQHEISDTRSFLPSERYFGSILPVSITCMTA